MADIRNSISLQDRMTPVFKSIINSMDRTMRVMRNLDRQANNGVQSRAYKSAQKAINQANNEITRMKNGLDQADRAAKRLEKTTQGVKNNTSKISGGNFNLVNLSAALYLFKNIEQVVSSIMDKVDQAISTQARLGLFNESQYSSKQLYGAAYQTALSTRTGLEETGNLATRILISDSMQGPGAALGSLKVAGIINKAAIAGGGTAEENRRALLQLSQSLASGVMQGDELRAIREQTPYLMSVIAKGLGKLDPKKFGNISMGDMKKLGAEGELTSERIIKAFLEMEGDVDKAFNQMPKTFGQAMTQLGTIWQYFLYMLYQGDGALALITKKAWQLADYLSSPQGEETLKGIAQAITVVVKVFLMLAEAAIKAIGWLSTHAKVALALLTALGVVLAIVAVQAIIAWVAAAWPFLLIAAVIGIVIYALLQMGVTFDQIVGSIVGGLTWLAGLFYNVGIYIKESFVNSFNQIKLKFNTVLLAILGGIDLLIQKINLIPGVHIDTTGLRDYENRLYNANKDIIAQQNKVTAFKPGWSDQWFGYGYKAGSDFINSFKGADFSMGMDTLKDMQVALNGWDPNSVKMNGGYLDSVGKVNISDEDLQLLKDIAAKDFLMNVKQVKPTAKITFGDVRETADVNKIMDVLEEMVENALATQLVTE